MTHIVEERCGCADVSLKRIWCEILRRCPLTAAAAPSGVVTFPFTDVEGSTRRWEADADEMRVAPANMRGHAGEPE